MHIIWCIWCLKLLSNLCFLSGIFICLDRSWTMFGLRLRFRINGSEIILLASKNSGWIINVLFYVIPTNNLLVLFLLKRNQFLKFNSSINLLFIWSPLNERSTYIKDFNCSWSTKSSHFRTALFTFIFIFSKQIFSLVFVIYGEYSCCFDVDVHPFTSSFILSTRLLLLH